MYEQLQAAHIELYAFTSKRELDAAHRAALSELNQPLTAFEAKIRFQLFAAKVHMGHTRVESPMPQWRAFLEDGGKRFPLQIRTVAGRSYIAENLSGSTGLKSGDEILSINGAPMKQWLARTERHVSAETPYMAHSLMEYDFAMYLWVEMGRRRRMTSRLDRLEGPVASFG